MEDGWREPSPPPLSASPPSVAAARRRWQADSERRVALTRDVAARAEELRHRTPSATESSAKATSSRSAAETIARNLDCLQRKLLVLHDLSDRIEDGSNVPHACVTPAMDTLRAIHGEMQSAKNAVGVGFGDDVGRAASAADALSHLELLALRSATNAPHAWEDYLGHVVESLQQQISLAGTILDRLGEGASPAPQRVGPAGWRATLSEIAASRGRTRSESRQSEKPCAGEPRTGDFRPVCEARSGDPRPLGDHRTAKDDGGGWYHALAVLERERDEAVEARARMEQRVEALEERAEYEREVSESLKRRLEREGSARSRSRSSHERVEACAVANAREGSPALVRSLEEQLEQRGRTIEVLRARVDELEVDVDVMYDLRENLRGKEEEARRWKDAARKYAQESHALRRQLELDLTIRHRLEEEVEQLRRMLDTSPSPPSRRQKQHSPQATRTQSPPREFSPPPASDVAPVERAAPSLERRETSPAEGRHEEALRVLRAAQSLLRDAKAPARDGSEGNDGIPAERNDAAKNAAEKGIGGERAENVAPPPTPIAPTFASRGTHAVGAASEDERMLHDTLVVLNTQEQKLREKRVEAEAYFEAQGDAHRAVVQPDASKMDVLSTQKRVILGKIEQTAESLAARKKNIEERLAALRLAGGRCTSLPA